jgi:hypothetical protein
MGDCLCLDRKGRRQSVARRLNWCCGLAATPEKSDFRKLASRRSAVVDVAGIALTEKPFAGN